MVVPTFLKKGGDHHGQILHHGFMADERSTLTTALAWIAVAAGLGAMATLDLDSIVRALPRPLENHWVRRLGPPPPLPTCKGEEEPSAPRLLQQLVSRLHPLFPEDSEIPIQVEVVSGETVNTFVTLGGRIYVFEGLLRQMQYPEELAGVLAHEIAHLQNRDLLLGLWRKITLSQFPRLVLGGEEELSPHLFGDMRAWTFTVSEEKLADAAMTERLHKAGTGNWGLHRLLSRLANEPSVTNPPIRIAHPFHDERPNTGISDATTTPTLATEDWQKLQRICP